MSFIVVIPARYASTRLPGKPLADIAGRPMVVHVAERARASGAEEVIVATDHPDVAAAVEKHGFRALMTRADHTTGTDRIAEVAAVRGEVGHRIIVNVQGDEPLVDPALIAQVADSLEAHPDAEIATACHPITDAAEIANPNVVKVVLDRQGYALYFSRAPIPYARDAYAGGIREVPATWAQWLEAMTRLQQAIGPDRRAVLLPLTEWEPPVIFALQRGAPLLRDGDRYGHFRDPAFRRALDFYLEFFRRGLAVRSAGSQVANLYLDFGAGYFASFLSGPWSIGELRERLPRGWAGAWATAPLPAPDGPAPGVSLAGGASLALFRGARHKPAAWAWMTYLLEPARQVEFHRLTGDLPSRRTAWTEAGLMREPHAAAFWRQLQHVRSTPKIPEWERIAQKVSQYVEATVREDLTVEAAVTALDHDVDAILEKRRWLLDRGQGAAAPGR